MLRKTGSRFILTVLSCLIFGQLSAIDGAWAQEYSGTFWDANPGALTEFALRQMESEAPPSHIGVQINQNPTLVDGIATKINGPLTPNGVTSAGSQPQKKPTMSEATPEQYAAVFDLALRMMQHKLLYSVLNQTFNPPTPPGLKPVIQKLTLTQVSYLLLAVPDHWRSIEDYLKKVPPDTPPNKMEETRARFQKMFDRIIKNGDLLKRFRSYSDPSRALLLEVKGRQSGYAKRELFLSHPWYADISDLNNPKDQQPADNMEQMYFDFIDGAKKEIIFNALDLDHPGIVDHLIAAKKRGVFVTGGIDKLSEKNPMSKVQIDRLMAEASDTFVFKLVDSVGLDHLKMMVRDTFSETAAMIDNSGNLTVSCISPKGDGYGLPENELSKYDVANANDARLFVGKLPAVIARQELRKILIYEMRGVTEFPTGGLFQLRGPVDPSTKRSTSATIGFSPNGGEGSMNAVQNKLLANTSGPIEATYFAFSDEKTRDTILQRSTREAKRAKEKGEPAINLFKGVFDGSFASRDWSQPLFLSGFQQDKITGKYKPIGNPAMKDVLNSDEYRNWLDDIRIGPEIYGDHWVRTPEGPRRRVTGKIHHKMTFLPKANLAIFASASASEASQTNNEQYIILQGDSEIIAKARGGFYWLFDNAKSNLVVEVARRNKFPPRPPKPGDPEDRELEEAARKDAEKKAKEKERSREERERPKEERPREEKAKEKKRGLRTPPPAGGSCPTFFD